MIKLENLHPADKFDLTKINEALSKIKTKQKEYEQLSQDRAGSHYRLSEILNVIQGTYSTISSECHLPKLEAWLHSEKETLDRESSEIGGQFGKALRQALPTNFDFAGNFPEFNSKFFLVKVDSAGNKVELFYGNGEEKLSSISPIDAKLTAEKIQNEYARITKKRYPGQSEFLKKVLDSYKQILSLKGVSFGDNVGIISILKELNVSFQKRGFWANPRQRFFNEYTREEFSYDLSKLADSSQRTIDGYSLQLGIATRMDDKNPENYLWIPLSETSKGTVYSTLCFRKKEDESA